MAEQGRVTAAAEDVRRVSDENRALANETAERAWRRSQTPKPTDPRIRVVIDALHVIERGR